MPTILYLIEQPLDDRNYERLGLQIWRDRGWTVEVWDFTPLAHARIWRRFHDSGVPLRQFDGYVPIENVKQIDTRLAAIRSMPYYIDFAPTARANDARIRLEASAAVRVVCNTGSIPAFVAREPLRQFRQRLRVAGVLETAEWIAGALGRRFRRPREWEPGVIVVAGEQSRRAAAVTSVRADVVAAHNLDYDLFLRLRDGGVPPARQFAVFLDDDLCFHTDFAQEGLAPHATAARYLPALRRGLDAFAATLDVEIRIAAHPRSTYWRTNPRAFAGIRAEYGKTAELIRDACVVICHYSTAVQLAVLFGKPVVFITTDELERSPAGKHIGSFAAALGKSVINLDHDLAQLTEAQLLALNAARYAAYRNEYIKMDGSRDAPFWTILIDHVEGVASASAGAAGETDTARDTTEDAQQTLREVRPPGET